MAAGGLPGVQALLDDGTGTFPYDLTAMTNAAGQKLVRVGYDLTRGRQDERGDVTAGQISNLVLDNTDGRFTLNSTVIATPSPIRADNRIRIKVTPSGGTTRNRFTGYVQEWPVEWPSGGDTLCEVTLLATDAQARAERRELLSALSEEEMLSSPTLVGLYVFDEPQGSTSSSDRSGASGSAARFTGSGPAPEFNESLSLPNGMPGVTLDNNSDTEGKFFRVPVAIASAWSVGVTFATSDTLLPGVIFETLFFANKNGSFDSRTAVVGSLNDGSVHHVMITSDAAGNWLRYHDGVAVAGGTDAANVGMTEFQIGGPASGVNRTTFKGMIGHCQIYNGVVAPADVADIAAACIANGLPVESGTARLTRLAAYAGVPVGSLDTSLTNVGYLDFAGDSDAAQMRAVATDAEVGIVFVDGSGNLTFYNRNRPFAKLTPDITLTADQADPGTKIPVDMQGVVNFFTAKAVGGGAQTAWNKVSEKGDGTVTNPGHGRYPDSKDLLVTTDDEALDRANWIVGNHGEPLPRIPDLKIDMLTIDATVQNQLLAAEADTWIRVTGLPSQAPGGTTADLLVQGFAEHLTPEAWDLTFNVVAMSMFRVWILGDSTYGVLGSTTRLAV